MRSQSQRRIRWGGWGYVGLLRGVGAAASARAAQRVTER